MAVRELGMRNIAIRCQFHLHALVGNTLVPGVTKGSLRVFYCNIAFIHDVIVGIHGHDLVFYLSITTQMGSEVVIKI